ncbi:Ig-like domain-containing protein [Sporosarcina sp.]|uniref:Ig-like domain-containing protein n=1 Tax=Sporosarcina sp. TaxID=49982 RepID=UPI002611B546|nr:Ig-like domain-containing protein [Sporosarcina sp.]
MKLHQKFALTWMLALTLLIALVPTAFAQTFPSEPIENLTKSWKVKFSQPVDPNSVTANNIYILDGSKKISTSLKLLNGGSVVEITPLTPYEPGKSYKLEVAGTMKSATGGIIHSKTTKLFDVLDNKAAIQSIWHTSETVLNQDITNFRIVTRSDVHTVKVNGVELPLTGWNEFSRGFNNVKPGASVTIKAYDSNKKTLETKMYKVE